VFGSWNVNHPAAGGIDSQAKVRTDVCGTSSIAVVHILVCSTKSIGVVH
jgi:hypothetical protein